MLRENPRRGLVCGAGAGSICRTLVLSLMRKHPFTSGAGFMDPYALNEETPKAVCALNSKGEKKEEKAEGRKKEKGKRETTRERP